VPVAELLAAISVATSAPVVPPALRSIIRVEGDCVIVRNLRGHDRRECLDTDGYTNSISAFDSFAGGRLVGFSYLQNDLSGYRLVDRAGRGEDAVVETGRRPIFSPNGRFFTVAVPGSYVAFFRGIGLWSLGDAGVRRLFFTDAANEVDWEIQSFPNDHCVLLAIVPEDAAETRRFYALTFGADVSLANTETAACPQDHEATR
jgi:hypothetical protein